VSSYTNLLFFKISIEKLKIKCNSRKIGRKLKGIVAKPKTTNFLSLKSKRE
jgi:hypothetical protein